MDQIIFRGDVEEAKVKILRYMDNYDSVSSLELSNNFNFRAQVFDDMDELYEYDYISPFSNILSFSDICNKRAIQELKQIKLIKVMQVEGRCVYIGNAPDKPDFYTSYIYALTDAGKARLNEINNKNHPPKEEI